MLAGIEELETVVAHAHMDMGWSWRGSRFDIDVSETNQNAFCANFDRAANIFAPFSELKPKHAFLAAAECVQRSGRQNGNAKIADAYATLIDLDPSNARILRSMGNHLLPRWFGDYDTLELEACRTAARKQDTWVQFDEIACDDTTCARLDNEFFVDG